MSAAPPPRAGLTVDPDDRALAALAAGDVAAAAQLACLLEASAAKPGNVSPSRHFHDVRFEDFLASAAAIGPSMLAAGEQPLGVTIRSAVEATRRWTTSNTNLGMILLLAPLASAALKPSGSLRTRVNRVLEGTTRGDAEALFEAIRLARPGGLGRVAEQDVSGVPSVTLGETMALAAGHDLVAREYATGFATTFDVGAPAIAAARRDGLGWPEAAVEGFLTLLAAHPDTLIVRKLGATVATAISGRAQDVLGSGGVRTPEGRRALERFDEELRDERNARNPGTTADLTAAAIFVVLLDERGR